MSVKKTRNDGGWRDARNSGGKICDWFNVGDEEDKNYSRMTHNFLDVGATD